MHGMKQQPLKRFPDNVERGQQQQACFNERRKALHFAVAVKVVGVGGLVRHAHGEERDDRGHQIENGMQRFGENSQAARGNGEKNLQGYQHHSRADRAQRSQLLLACCLGGDVDHICADYTTSPISGRRLERSNASETCLL